MSELLATCTTEHYNTVIYHLPEGWTSTNEREMSSQNVN
jgi:hypothetical protein